MLGAARRRCFTHGRAALRRVARARIFLPLRHGRRLLGTELRSRAGIFRQWRPRFGLRGRIGLFEFGREHCIAVGIVLLSGLFALRETVAPVAASTTAATAPAPLIAIGLAAVFTRVALFVRVAAFAFDGLFAS